MLTFQQRKFNLEQEFYKRLGAYLSKNLVIREWVHSILDQHYSPKFMPRWINKEMFYDDLTIAVVEQTLYSCHANVPNHIRLDSDHEDYDPDEGCGFFVDLDYQLAIPYCSDNFDQGANGGIDGTGDYDHEISWDVYDIVQPYMVMYYEGFWGKWNPQTRTELTRLLPDSVYYQIFTWLLMCNRSELKDIIPRDIRYKICEYICTS